MANEKRLIDAWRLVIDLAKIKKCGEYDYEDVLAVIASQNTVDAVEVVRCKDCKHWHEETGWCTKHSHFVGFDGMACHPSQSSEWKMFNADDFCSNGERREGE